MLLAVLACRSIEAHNKYLNQDDSDDLIAQAAARQAQAAGVPLTAAEALQTVKVQSWDDAVAIDNLLRHHANLPARPMDQSAAAAAAAAAGPFVFGRHTKQPQQQAQPGTASGSVPHSAQASLAHTGGSMQQQQPPQQQAQPGTASGSVPFSAQASLAHTGGGMQQQQQPPQQQAQPGTASGSMPFIVQASLAHTVVQHAYPFGMQQQQVGYLQQQGMMAQQQQVVVMGQQQVDYVQQQGMMPQQMFIVPPHTRR
jgi:hypothetical protein